jgi:integrase
VAERLRATKHLRPLRDSCLRTRKPTLSGLRSLTEKLKKLTTPAHLANLGLLFTTEVGPLINPTDLRSFHDLRHTCATVLFSRGIHPKYVQELLGHSNIAITLDTYSHLIPGMGITRSSMVLAACSLNSSNIIVASFGSA